MEGRITTSRLAVRRGARRQSKGGKSASPPQVRKGVAVGPLTPGGDTPWRDARPGGAAYREIVHLKPAGAALTRARRAAVPAWHTLIQVAVGADPAPAWRSPWQRRAAVWGLAAGTAAAVTASVVYVTFSAAGKKTLGTVGKTPPPQISKDLGQNPAHHGQGGLIGFLNLQGTW